MRYSCCEFSCPRIYILKKKIILALVSLLLKNDYIKATYSFSLN